MATRSPKTEKTQKILVWLAFLAYLLVLFKLVFFKHPLHVVLESIRGSSEGVLISMNLVPFATIMNYFKGVPHSQVAIENLLGNLILFLPLGLLLPLLWKRVNSFPRIFLISLSFSLLLELGQLTLRVGSFDVDDLILNTLGALVGYTSLRIFSGLSHKNAGS